MTDAAATVLVVDDEADLADLYATFLEPEYDVRTATSGAEALEEADGAVDVALLDRRMPDMSGDKVLERIRDRGIDARVVMITAVEPDFDIVELPFDDYLRKPVQREDLFAVVEQQLRAASYEERIAEFFSVSSKLGVLETEKSPGELEDHEEYQRLQRRIEELKPRLDDAVEEFDNMVEAFDSIDRT